MNIRKFILLVLTIIPSSLAFAQLEEQVLDLKDPLTGKWGYASKIQNRKSPLKGLKKFTVQTLGKSGASMMSKKDAEDIDWIVPPLYDAVAPEFSEHLAGVEIGGQVGFIDIHNRFIIQPQFESIKDLAGFSKGLAAVKMGSKYGYINKKGEVVISPQFDHAENFRDNLLAVVKQDGKFGAIDLAGKVVVPCKYITKPAMISLPISNKTYRHVADSVKKAFADHCYDSIWSSVQDCDRVVNAQISDSLWIQTLNVTPVGDGAFRGLKDNYNRMLIPSKYSSITYDEDNHIYIVTDSLNHYGVYTYKGNRLFHALFDSIGPFTDGRSLATVDNISGYVDIHGDVDPVFMDEICNMGLQYDISGQSLKARTLYNRILQIDPNHVMALNNLAIMDINIKEYNEGMRKLKLAHKLAPDNELISENLHIAKKNRNERRWNRITTGLEIAAAIITLGAATYSAVNGVSAPSSNLSSGGSSGGYDTSGSSMSGSSAHGHSSDSSTKKASHANWRALDSAYDGYETTLMRMRDSRNYDKSEVRSIQRKMKDIRKKIYEQSGGHNRAVSSMENWNP